MWVKDKASLKERKVEPVKVSSVLKVEVPKWYLNVDKTDGEYDMDVDGGVSDRYDLDVI